jgi:hypothetical protein
LWDKMMLSLPLMQGGREGFFKESESPAVANEKQIEFAVSNAWRPVCTGRGGPG